MFDFLYSDFNYIALFSVSFISATLLPLASEAFVLAFLKLDFNPTLVLLIATFGNSLGSLSTYGLAYLGKEKILEKYFAKSLEKLEKLSLNFSSFGSIFAFLTFLPIIGDLFALGLGFAKYSFFKACIFITLGKFCRYLSIIFLANFL